MISVPVKSGQPNTNNGSNNWTPLALGFRPFFVLAIWFAILLMLVTSGGFLTGIWHYNYFDLPLWHAHEMIFGFSVAVIAGFLLTAVRNWTAVPTPTEGPLAVLVLVWLLPRLLSAVAIPPLLYALVDFSFLPILATVLFNCIRKAGQPHHYMIPVLLLLLACTNFGIHLDQLEVVEGIRSQMLHLAVLTLLAIIVVVGGKVFPFFIASATAERREANRVVERLALVSIFGFAMVNLLMSPLFVAVAAIAVAVLHALRLYGWYTHKIWDLPMLWVLWLGYGWLIIGFLLYAALSLFDLPLAEAIHAWTIGAVGMFTVGMMARVSLGHTGRVVAAIKWMPTAFVLLLVSAVARVVLPILNPDWLDVSIVLAASAWIMAFAITAFRYSGLLVRPRVDGKEG